MGKKTLAPHDSADSPYSSSQFLLPTFKHDYIFHVDYGDSDNRKNMPAIFPRRDSNLTSDMFPRCASWWEVSVGPLLARSSEELIFVSTVKGDESAGKITRVGLLRVAVMSVPDTYGQEKLGEPIMEDIEVGDLSRWTIHHQPPMQEHVRLAFPKSYTFPSAMMYDFKVHRPVACLPFLVPHFLGSSRPSPMLPAFRHSLPTVSLGTNNEGTYSHRPVSPIHSKVNDNQSSTSFVSANVVSSTEKNSAYPLSFNHDPSLSVQDVRAAFTGSSAVELTSQFTTAREFRPLPRRHCAVHSSASLSHSADETALSLASPQETNLLSHQQNTAYPVMELTRDGGASISRGGRSSSTWVAPVNEVNTAYMFQP